MLKSKIYNLRVTDTYLHYNGSISIDSKLMEEANIIEYEQVHVLDKSNGKRFITYAIAGKENEICVNGAAAHLVEIGDELIILAYEITDGGNILGRYARIVNANK